jgi:hypothetical protein
MMMIRIGYCGLRRWAGVKPTGKQAMAEGKGQAGARALLSVTGPTGIRFCWTGAGVMLEQTTNRTGRPTVTLSRSLTAMP